ncbi:uncharacterized protein THITE_2114639 [Thermothielavioides terrestris NRRL 8126]|uniref:Uncharacterized protein n=2 Tax=Thermothielavioides terrestris TaxID=2587410 RepID=G2R112_THETT|nr:uncharacterized protein THITE_2114639 [Thermothielavioides terrestris NRRL 8126]AEO66509.1 hypothetical protein THITE_2114639 [Thermothielavioides terrestris NRRL 8126]
MEGEEEGNPAEHAKPLHSRAEPTPPSSCAASEKSEYMSMAFRRSPLFNPPQPSSDVAPHSPPASTSSAAGPSTAAVDSRNDTPSAEQDQHRQQPSQSGTPSPRCSTNEAWPLSSPPATLPTPPEPKPSASAAAATTARSKGKWNRRVTSTVFEERTIGLQICSKLLTDQLARALLPKRPEGAASGSSNNASGSGANGGAEEEEEESAQKLQVMLLIEAYEGVLEECRETKEELEEEAGENEVEGAAELDDAVQILEHWLDSLHTIYHDAFEGDD